MSGQRPAARPAKPPREYLRLVEAHPLVPIADDKAHAAALEFLGRSADRDLGPWEASYFDVLTTLIHRYESEKFRPPRTDAADALKFLLEEHGLSVAELGRRAGVAKSTLSEILSRRRGVSPGVRARLCEHFGVGPEAFV